jgi:hypothetical protein
MLYAVSHIRGQKSLIFLGVNDPLKRSLHLKMIKYASKYLKIPAQVMKIVICHYGWLKWNGQGHCADL